MREKVLSLVLTIVLLISTFPVTVYGDEAVVTENAKYDVFISSDKQLGFDTTALSALVDAKLAEMNVSGGTSGSTTSDARIESTTVIDTTDLSSWYVYDHYDTSFWNNSANWLSGSTSKDDAWMNFYDKPSITDVTRPANFISDPYAWMTSYSTIEDMIETGNITEYGYAQLLREHIYSYEDAGVPGMWFAGYSSAAYADFLFYPTASTGEKNVKFTVNSQFVNTHSLNGAGFLINTGINSNGYIGGYILYYAFSSASAVSSVTLYKINSNVLASTLNSGTSAISTYATSIGSISNPSWSSVMDIELDITPTSIIVKQGASNGTKSQIMQQTITDSGYNGFGPIVKYSGHGCSSSSVFKFSNLEMSFAGITGNSLLAGLESADYLKDSTVQKFFVNLVASDYGTTATDKDLAYINILQDKNISLITNYINGGSSYITDYMGDNSKNLNSLPTGNSNVEGIQTYDINAMGSTTDIDKLAQDIAYYIYSVTYDGSTGTIANTATTVAKLYLLEKIGDVVNQVSIILNELLTSSGQKVYLDNTGTVNEGSITPRYSMIKPGAATVETISPLDDNDGYGPYFVVTGNKTSWPIGLYSVTLSYGDDTISATTKFEVQQDTSAPSVSAVINGGLVDLTFTNSKGSGNYEYASDLLSYSVVNTSTTTTPTEDWSLETLIDSGSPTASTPITQNGYMHVFVKDEAGNVGHSYIEITQLVPVVENPTAGQIVYGQPLSNSVLGGGTATFNSDTVAGTFSWVNTTYKPNAGTAQYAVIFTPVSGLYATVTMDVSITVEKATSSIALSDKTAVYTGNSISISAAAVTGVNGMSVPTGNVTYTYYTDISCTTLTTFGNSGAAGNGEAPVLAGKYYAKATLLEDANYISATTTAPGTLVIEAADPNALVITGIPDAITYGDESFTLSTTGGSGTGSVTYTSNNPLVASVTENGYVTINRIGTADITATKAADGNYEAKSITNTITVAKKAVTYEITGSSRTYTGSPLFAIVVPSDASFDEGTDYTVTYKKADVVVAEPISMGEYAMTVTTVNANYSGSQSGTFKITDATQTELAITGIPSGDIEYLDTFTLLANGGSGTGAITWSSDDGEIATVDIDTGEVEIVGLGKVTITATKAADDNYSTTTDSATFTAVPKAIMVTAVATNRSFIPDSKSVSVALNTGIEGVEAIFDSAVMNNANAGNDKDVCVSKVVVSNANYKALSSTVYTTVTITPISDTNLTINGLPESLIYNDADFRLTSVSTGTGDVSWTSDDLDVVKVNSSTGYVTITGAGNATITAQKDSDGNYKSVEGEIWLTVEQKAVIYTVKNNTTLYTGEPKFATITPSLTFDFGKDYKVIYELGNEMVEEPIEAGIYDISVITLNNNYVGSTTGAALTIQAAQQNYDLNIGGIPSYIEYEDEFALYANGGSGEGDILWEVTDGTDFASIDSNGKVTVTGVGSVTVKATKEADGNYEEKSKSVTFVTKRKELTVSISGTHKNYTGEVQSVSLSGTHTENNALSDIVDIVYNLKSDGSEVEFRNVDTYNVTVSVSEIFEELYKLSDTTTDIATIDRTKLIITADDKEKTYGSENPVLTMSYNLMGSDNLIEEPKITCVAVESSGVGGYEILLSFDEDDINNNYDIQLISGVLHVEKAELVIAADDLDVYYLDNPPIYSVGYHGLIESDEASDLLGSLVMDCEYISGDSIGSFPIIASGLSSNNYSISYEPGTLTVETLSISMTATATTKAIYVKLSPVVSGLKLENLILSEGLTGYSIYETKNVGNYTIPVIMNSGTEYQISFDMGDNYSFDTITFRAVAPINSGGSTYAPDPVIEETTTEEPIVEETPEEETLPEISEMAFTDINEDQWFYDAVKYVCDLGIMTDTGDNAFSPNLNTTRGMIVTILYRMEGLPEVSQEATFKDVTPDKWYSDAVVWGSINGIVKGYDIDTFKPDQNISRQQLAAVLYRYAMYKGYDVSAMNGIDGFEDADEISEWAIENMIWAVSQEIVIGTSNTTLDPNGDATRSQLATILMRFLENNVK